MPFRLHLSFLGALFLAAALVSSCRVYDPDLVVPGVCVGRRPPPRPTEDADPQPEVFFGLRDVVLNQSRGALWQDIGFNLDGLCTGSPEFAHECETVSGGRPQPDGNDGIDNAFGAALYPIVEAALPGLEATAREAQLLGIGFPVLRLRDWNGTPNDAQIDVTITQAVVAVPGDGENIPEIQIVDFRAQLLDGSPAPPPNWDGNDYVWVREDTFVAGNVDDALVHDDRAYVANGVLVMTLPERVEILFATADAGVTVRLTDALATAVITETGLDNVLVGGRWSRVDLLRTAESVGLCRGSLQYNALESTLEGLMDVRSDPRTGGEGVPCDALSTGVRFTGFRVKFAGLETGRSLPDLCTTQTDAGTPTMDAGVDSGL